MIDDKKIRIIFYTLAVLNVAVIMAYCFGVYEIYSERSRIADKSAELKEEIKRENYLNQLTDTLNKTGKERTRINSYFVDIKGTVGFLEKLQSFGRMSGVSVRLNNVDVENKSALKIDISTQGDFESIYKMLQLMENTPYVIELGSINISKINISDSKGVSRQLWGGNFTVRLKSFVNR